MHPHNSLGENSAPHYVCACMLNLICSVLIDLLVQFQFKRFIYILLQLKKTSLHHLSKKQIRRDWWGTKRLDWFLSSSLLIITVVIVASNTQFWDRRTDEEKEIKDAAAVRLEHVRAHTYTTADIRKTLCVSMDSWRERGEEDERKMEWRDEMKG